MGVEVHATTILLVLGIALAIAAGGRSLGFILCIVWVLSDVFVINPFIYYMVLPKPIGDHVMEGKRPLDGSERNIKLQELLKKYETGEEIYHRKK